MDTLRSKAFYGSFAQTAESIIVAEFIKKADAPSGALSTPELLGNIVPGQTMLGALTGAGAGVGGLIGGMNRMMTPNQADNAHKRSLINRLLRGAGHGALVGGSIVPGAVLGYDVGKGLGSLAGAAGAAGGITAPLLVHRLLSGGNKSETENFIRSASFNRRLSCLIDRSRGMEKSALARGIGRLAGGGIGGAVKGMGMLPRIMGSGAGGFSRFLTQPFGNSEILKGIGRAGHGFMEGFHNPGSIFHPTPPMSGVARGAQSIAAAAPATAGAAPEVAQTAAAAAPSAIGAAAGQATADAAAGAIGSAGGAVHGPEWQGWTKGIDPSSWKGKLLFGRNAGNMGYNPPQLNAMANSRLRLGGLGVGALGTDRYIDWRRDEARRNAVRGMNRFSLGLSGLLGGPEGVIKQLHL